MTDEAYMREALRLARNGRGRTSPNPMVGAVLVRDGRVVGEGWHRRAGTEHAEIHALRMAGPLAAGATLYVTLEPCAHTGHTGPCARALIEAGVRRVVASLEDPNPLVAGKGLQMLREAGVEVACGLLEAEARRLNEAFLKWIVTGRPFVTLKMAMTLDGKIASAAGASQWITGEPARIYGHALRDENDAVLVGIGTVLADHPALTARLPDGSGRHPRRVILDSRARISPDEPLLHDGLAPVLIAVTEEAPEAKVETLRALGAEVLVCGARPPVDAALLMRALGERSITSALVEGGGAVHFSMLAAGLADKVRAFIAPMLLGGREAASAVAGAGFLRLEEAARLRDVEIERLGEDILLTGYIRR